MPMGKLLMFNLSDEMTKDLAEVLTNNTSRQIVNLLADSELTATDISAKLNIPLNTLSYNLTKLKKVGLIEEKDFYYSEKGKKMPKYGVVNKHILISPKEPKGIKTKLSSLLPIAVLGVAGSFIFLIKNIPQAEIESAKLAVYDASLAIAPASQNPLSPLLLFFLGGLIVWITYQIVEYWRKK